VNNSELTEITLRKEYEAFKTAGILIKALADKLWSVKKAIIQVANKSFNTNQG